MKSVVRYSTFSIIITCGVIVILAIGLISTWGTYKFSIACGLTGFMTLLGLLYAPISISINKAELLLHSPLKTHKLNIADICSAEPFQPTMGSKRILGSGGFMGYWGIFHEGDIGKYTGFYGKSSDCFLIIMKNGDKYVLGCKDRSKIINALHHITTN